MINPIELGRALESLSSLYLARVQLDLKTSIAVGKARKAGASWQNIGDALLIAPWTARRIYRDLPQPLGTDYVFPLQKPSTGSVEPETLPLES
jgi:hypothetical protein